MASTNVQVAVRCRPMSGSETRRGSTSVVDVSKKDRTVKVTNRHKGDEPTTYTYDHAYPPDIAQETVYSDIGAPLVTKAFEGFNATIFAYGQTGSGKTFTMMGVLGDHELEGVIPRLIGDLFARSDKLVAESERKQVMVTVSYLEIYNEVIHDLLNPQAGDNLKIREHPELGIYVDKLCELVAKEPGEIMRLIEQGNRVRKVAATQMNERSSRSHSVFTLKLAQKETQDLEDGMQREIALGAKLNLVDLAGSERAGKTGAEGSTLKEGAAINQSLMALGAVINALSEGGAFVPYRNSKLTRLLQESLGGNAATLMVANISPADYNTEETIGTLRYASRAKDIKNVVTRNEDVHEKVIRELHEEIERLKQELERGGPRALLEEGAVKLDSMTAEERAEYEKQLADQKAKEAALEERLAFIEHAKNEEWQQRELLTKELEEERQNNLNRQIKDVMSSVKSEKLRLINEVRALQDRRNALAEDLHALTDDYRDAKAELESTMHEYEDFQAAYDRMDPSDPTYEQSGEELISILSNIEELRAGLIDVRERVSEMKQQVHDVETELASKKAELQAAASTIAEHDRLRVAIQNEERAAFQAQRDSYLNEQLVAERERLAVHERALLDQAASLEESDAQKAKALDAAQRHNALLLQEVELYKREKAHMEEQLQVVTTDLDAVVDEKHRLEKDFTDLEAKLSTADFAVEEEQSKTEQLQEELWRAKHAAEAERRELEEAARKAKAEAASIRRAQHAEEKARRTTVVDPAGAKQQPGQSPAVAEAKDPPSSGGGGGGGDDSSKTRALAAKLTNAIQDKTQAEQRRRELETTLAEYEEERSHSAAQAKEKEYQVFKSVMDVANKDRLELQAKCAQLEALLRQSVQDIMYLQRANDNYAAELDRLRAGDE